MLKRLYFCEVSIVFLKKGHTDLLHPCRNLVLVVAMTQSYHGTFVVFGNVFDCTAYVFNYFKIENFMDKLEFILDFL